MGWLRKHPIAAFLPLQALLGFWNLGLRSPWMDEAETLLVARRPVREVLRFVSEGSIPVSFSSSCTPGSGCHWDWTG